MTRVVLVRHARPTMGFAEDRDPGLDELGRRQALAVADRLDVGVGGRAGLAVVTSPLRRARETAMPIAAKWQIAPTITDAFGEIPTPSTDLSGRAQWLQDVLARRWADVDASLLEWRDQLLDALEMLHGDTVVFTHYVAINTAVGAATGDDRLVSFAPAHASVTELEVRPGALEVVSLAAPTDVDGDAVDADGDEDDVR